MIELKTIKNDLAYLLYVLQKDAPLIDDCDIVSDNQLYDYNVELQTLYNNNYPFRDFVNLIFWENLEFFKEVWSKYVSIDSDHYNYSDPSTMAIECIAVILCKFRKNIPTTEYIKQVHRKRVSSIRYNKSEPFEYICCSNVYPNILNGTYV